MLRKLNKKLLANALRFLSIDAIQQANSGHPGMPMGMADVAEVLWNDFLNHNPDNPNWINRDRFVLSNGHGCMLLYALLHLTGYPLSLEDLQQFRQLHSKTPGHPEYLSTIGIEASTGPLGQGIAMATGMALAEKLLAQTFNRETFNIINHYTYCFAGDGCLMEGISHEACSLAGTLGLNKLIVFWDDNSTSIDGNVQDWFTENIPQRFAAYNWNVVTNVNGHDPASIIQAINKAKIQLIKPSLICCKTTIGYGSPTKAGKAQCHGSPFSEQELLDIRTALNWPYPPFSIPKEIYQAWNYKKQGTLLNSNWDNLLQAYQQQYPDLAAELQRRIAGKLPNNLQQNLENFLLELEKTPQQIATRQASKLTLDFLSTHLPELLGGSADLSCSCLTLHQNANPLKLNQNHQENSDHNNIPNYIHYGVREFGMFAIMNGIALHKGFIPYGGTFLVFADYGKNALRLSALMQQKVIYVLTHDSIGLGEDGPTHQPIEQLSMLRTTPNISVWRPADPIETIVAWQQAILSNTINTTCIVLTRQAVLQQPRTKDLINQIKRGGYIIYESPVNESQDQVVSKKLPAIIIATGSELELAMQAAQELADTVFVRVVSMPNMNVFLQQDQFYQDSVLPTNITIRVAVEAGSTFIWHKFVGLTGKVIGIDRFGLSAPYKQLYQEFNITVDAIKQAVLQQLPIN